jgi:hypothetical protein
MSSSFSNYTAASVTFRVHAKSVEPSRKTAKGPEPFSAICDSPGYWAQDCKKITALSERLERLKRETGASTASTGGILLQTAEGRGKHNVLSARSRIIYLRICDDGNKTKSPSTHTNCTSVRRTKVTTWFHALVSITGPTGLSRLDRCVLDGGSQSSFIATSFIDDLKLQAIIERELTVCALE